MNEPHESRATENEIAPDSIDALTQDRKKRRNKLLGFGVGLVLVAGGGLVGLTRYQDAQQRAAITSAWSSFSGCMLGSLTLDDGDRASLKFRRIQLTAMTLSEAERAQPGSDKPWPMSCGPLGHATNEALKGSSLSEAPLAGAIEALAKDLGDGPSFSADLGAKVDAVWDEADKLHLATDVNAKWPKAPLESHPLSATSLGKTTPLSAVSFPLQAAYTEAHPAAALRLLIEERSVKGSPLLCTFDAASPEAQCATLPKAIAAKSGLRLLGTSDDDSPPLVFAGNRGSDGVFRADSGELVESVYSYGGYAKKDGSSAVLGWDEKQRKPLLSRKIGAGARDRLLIDTNLRVSNFYYDTQILWDLLLLRGVTKQNERRFFATPYPWHGDGLPFVDVGELPEPGLIDGGADEPPHIAGCRSKDSTIVRVKGRFNDFLSFYSKGKWSPPVSPELTGGTLSCHGAEAVVTRLEPAGTDNGWKTSVSQVHCTPAGCRGTLARMEPFLKHHYEFGPRDMHVDAVDLDGKLLIVWAAGERGGVRMRLAAPEQIDKAEDVILFDDLINNGQAQKLTTLFDLRLFSREGYAVLLLSSVAGVHAVRIDAGGKVAPIVVKTPAP